MENLNKKEIPENEFPMPIKFGKGHSTEFYNSSNNIKVTMTNFPRDDFKRRCYNMIKSTWANTPKDFEEVNQVDVDKTFKDLLSFKVLPNSMEQLSFTFLIEGLTMIEVTHMLRHRMFSSIHAQCSADRFLNDDSAFIPSSVDKTCFADEYKELTRKCKDLYCRMVDSKEVSILDARYILNRNHRYFYYFTMNLKDAMAFINQRKCTQIQPELDNIIAHQIFDEIATIIPEIKDVISLKCDERCFYIKAPDKDNSRIYAPDKNHQKFFKEGTKTLYSKTRKEMGADFNPQDE